MPSPGYRLANFGLGCPSDIDAIEQFASTPEQVR
jgi:hypothetical protein